MATRIPGRIAWVWAGLAILSSSAAGQTAQAPMPAKAKADPPSAEVAVLQMLLRHPVTAPYTFRTARRNGKVVLAGRVGTKEVHDVAVRLAMNVTSSIDDRLVIDTAEAHRAAATPPSGRLTAGFGPVNSAYSVGSGAGPVFYPPPLFGRYDEPFFGFEPPAVSYPPGWNGVAARRGDPFGAPVLDPNSPIGPDPGPATANANRANPAAPAPPTAATAPAPAATAASGDTVEMSLDPRGVAVLRGTVPTNDDRVGVGQKVARMAGVTEVVNLLNVREDAAQPIPAARSRDVPPPPPTPAEFPGKDAAPPAPIVPGRAAQAQVPAPVMADDPADRPGDDATIARRLAANLARRPILDVSTLKAEVRDGVATLSGKLPTALEAMTAFRVAQQTIGVREVTDRLEFAVPDGQKENPLIAKGRPEDVEPYLEAQVRRQVGDKAHIDRLRVSGDRLEVRGTIVRDSDKPRIEAILRSMPLLRGFQLDAKLVAE